MVLSDIDRDRGIAVAKELQSEFRACDMRKAADIKALFVDLDPQVLFNNAGIAGPTRSLPGIAPH